MQKPKKRTSPKKTGDWLKYINDCLPALVTPIGSRFQADVPEWKGPSDDRSQIYVSHSSRLLGTRTWPPVSHTCGSAIAITRANAPKDGRKIGQGRPDSCTCSSPGSVQCVKLHVSEARNKLQAELGPVFKRWKFDEMGEDVGKSWSPKQKRKFVELVKKNPLSENKSFLRPAVESFKSKTRKEIVSYYLNVHVPKRIEMLTRSGCQKVDSDEDEVADTSTSTGNSLKRSRPTHVDITELVKSHYLTGRR